jgi:hypothetical protein
VVDPVEGYKFITSRIASFENRMGESFNSYIQLSSAVVGGYVWTRTQLHDSQLLGVIHVLAPVLLVLIGTSTVLLVVFDVRSWCGYRKAESNLTGGAAPNPRFPGSMLQELVMITFVVVTTALGASYLWLQS